MFFERDDDFDDLVIYDLEHFALSFHDRCVESSCGIRLLLVSHSFGNGHGR